jgi:hypothetical protein
LRRFHDEALRPMKDRRIQFLLIAICSVALCSLASHAAIRWLRIKSSWGVVQNYGTSNFGSADALHGSSLAYSGIDWNKVSEATGCPIESFATAGGSPPEWEAVHSRTKMPKRTFVVVSPPDLNEWFLCDFRAEIVPLSQTLRDLHQSNPAPDLSKKILRQYPTMFTRKLFPTVGRADGVMVGIRSKLQKLFSRGPASDEGEMVKFGGTGPSEINEKVSDWSEARLQRRLLLVRNACQGKYSFGGPKQLALMRLLRQAATEGEAVLIVVPVPPVYQKEFLAPEVMRDFEKTLATIQKGCPAAKVLRLDQVPSLEDNDKYFDIVHMNASGQAIATQELLSQLKPVVAR